MLKDWEGNGRFSYYLSEARLRITFSNYPRTEPAMDIRGWKSLWKVFATIGIANLFFFFVILFVYTLDNSTLLWILIAIESTCYLGVLITYNLLYSDIHSNSFRMCLPKSVKNLSFDLNSPSVTFKGSFNSSTFFGISNLL